MERPGLASVRLLLVPLTPELAAWALGRGPAVPVPAPELVPAPDWPDDLAAPLLALPADGWWLVVLRPGDPGTVVGICGVRAVHADDELEIGYGLAPSARGRGLGAEAVGTLVDHLLGRPGVAGVVAETEAGNTASRRLLLRLGFAEAGPQGRFRRCGTTRPALPPRLSGPPAGPS